MPNLRLVHDNAADRATVVASSTTGQMIAAHLLSEIKGVAHRSVGTAVTYALTWPSLETIGGVALPATNLTPDATIRVRAFDAETGGVLLADTDALLAAPGPMLDVWDWNMPLNANAFAFGGAVKVSAWLSEHVAVRRLEITLSDPNNPAGFIDCSRIVAGRVWSPTYNASYGLALEPVDTTTSTRTDSGDERSDRGPGYDRVALDLAYLDPADRGRFVQILRGTQGGRRLFLSVFPENGDPLLEQDHMFYGRLPRNGVIGTSFRLYSTKIQIEGW